MPMPPERAQAHRSPDLSFYGWRIVGVAFVVDFIAVGFFFYSFGVFFKALASELGGGSRAEVALGLSISGCVGALLAPFFGRLLDRVSIRRFMIAGAFLVGLGFGALSLVTRTWQYYAILATLFGVGMSMMGGLSSAKLVANWFEARRGTALGVATVGVSLAGLVMPAVATWLISHVGWRGGFRIYAVATVVVVVPLVARFVVNRPEDLGLEPDGDAPRAGEDGAPARVDVAWRTRDIVRSRDFWAVGLAFGLAFASLSAILTHLVPHADDLGISSYRAAALLSLAAGAGVLGKLAYGWLVDRLDARVAAWASFAAQIAGLAWIMRGHDFAGLAPAVTLFGFGMGGVVPLQGALIAQTFGRLSFGKVSGLLRPVQLPLHMTGTPLAGLVYDRTGSYDAAFWIFLGAYAAACLAAGGLRTTQAPGPADPLPATSGHETGVA